MELIDVERERGQLIYARSVLTYSTVACPYTSQINTPGRLSQGIVATKHETVPTLQENLLLVPKLSAAKEAANLGLNQVQVALRGHYKSASGVRVISIQKAKIERA